MTELLIQLLAKNIGYTVLIVALSKTALKNYVILRCAYTRAILGKQCSRCLAGGHGEQRPLQVDLNGKLAYMTREEAITKANSHGHKFDGTWTNEAHGDPKDWPYKFRATCQLCNGIIVSHEVPSDTGIPIIMGLPLTEQCVKTYDYYTKSQST